MEHSDESDFNPPFEHCFMDVAGQLTDAKVDLSWLRDYDLDMIDAVQAYTAWEVCRIQERENDGAFTSEDDLLVCASGVSRAIADVFAAYRNPGIAEDALFPLLFHIAMLGYQSGVRDAFEERLSRESMRRVAQKRARADRGHDVMRELYDDIRGE